MISSNVGCASRNDSASEYCDVSNSTMQGSSSASSQLSVGLLERSFQREESFTVLALVPVYCIRTVTTLLDAGVSLCSNALTKMPFEIETNRLMIMKVAMARSLAVANVTITLICV